MHSDAESSSYAGSAASISSTEEFSINDFVTQVEAVFDPLPLDRALVIEAQLSGLTNSAVRDLEELTEQAIELVPQSKETAARGKELVRLISADLDWIDHHLTALSEKVRMAHPIEYSAAKEKIRPGAL